MPEILSEGIETTALSPISTATRLLKLIAINGAETGLLTVGQVLDLVIGSAPGALDTLDELAAALADDANFAATITALLAQKASLAGVETLTNKTLTTPVLTRPLISGVVNAGNAAAGDVGERLSAFLASGSALAFTSATSRNILSLNLTAGDWDVQGNMATEPGASTVTSILSAGLSLTSATPPAPSADGYAMSQICSSSLAGGRNILSTGNLLINVASPTTVYLVGTAVFSGGTLSGFGAITARRRR